MQPLVEDVRASTSIHQVDHAEQRDGPDESDKEAPNVESRCSRDAEKVEEKSTDKAADDTDDNICQNTAATLHHHARQPSGKRTNHDPGDQSNWLHNLSFLRLIIFNYAQDEYHSGELSYDSVSANRGQF
jgi:hypothetical protein